jgi:hypothetical protein
LVKADFLTNQTMQLNCQHCLPDKLLEGVRAIEAIDTIGSNNAILKLE